MSQTWRILLAEVETEFHPKYRSHRRLILGGERVEKGERSNLVIFKIVFCLFGCAQP